MPLLLLIAFIASIAIVTYLVTNVGRSSRGNLQLLVGNVNANYTCGCVIVGLDDGTRAIKEQCETHRGKTMEEMFAEDKKPRGPREHRKPLEIMKAIASANKWLDKCPKDQRLSQTELQAIHDFIERAHILITKLDHYHDRYTDTNIA